MKNGGLHTLQKLERSQFAGIIHKPRVSEAEFTRHAQFCRQCNSLEPSCPRCHGAGFLSTRIGVGQFDYRPCECRSVSLARARELYSGLSSKMPTQNFGNFVMDSEVAAAAIAAREFAEQPTPYCILTITGGVGTGKTHLLQAIGWATLEGGRQAKFVPVASYLDKLRATFSDESRTTFENVYRPMQDAQVLLLDDLGAERITLWGQEQLYKIVNHRYQERLPMAVAMNLDLPSAADTYGERTADRLFDTGSGRVQVVSTGAVSYRTGR